MFLYPPRLSLEALSKIPHTTNRFEAVWWSWNRTTFRTVSWLWGIHLLTRGWLPGTGAILMEIGLVAHWVLTIKSRGDSHRHLWQLA